MSLDQGMYTGAVSVDLQKAFDLMNYGIPSAKLEAYTGISEKSLEWFSVI